VAGAQRCPVDELDRDRRIPRRALRERGVEKRDLGRSRDGPDRLEGPGGERPDGLPGSQQVAGPEQLRAEAPRPTDPPDDEAGEQEESEAVGLGVSLGRLPLAFRDPDRPRATGPPRLFELLPTQAGGEVRVAAEDFDDFGSGGDPLIVFTRFWSEI
jgi:hypothetical protein